MQSLTSSESHKGNLTIDHVRLLLLMWSVLALNVMLIVFMGVPFAQC